MVVPLFTALGLAAMVVLAVKKGHCRSRLLGGLLGCVTGIIVYLGYYYIAMVHDLGLESADNFALLPKYNIEFRMKTNVIKDVGAPDHDRNEDKPRPDRPYFNWAFFALEFGLIVCIPSGGGFRWSRRPYCERCQSWMKRESTTFKPEVGPGFVEALRLGSVQSLAALFTSPQKPGVPHSAVAVDYCPTLQQSTSADCPIYMSVKQVKSAAKGVTMDSFEQSKGKMLVRQTLVTREEIAALLPRFASLEKAAGTTAAEALKKLQVEIKSGPVTQIMADVKPVDPLYAGKVLTKKNALIGTAIMLLGLAGVFVPIGLGALGGFLAFPDHPPAGGVPIALKLFGGTLIGVAILIFTGNMIMIFTVPDYFATRFITRLTLREFGRRSNPLVSSADTGAFFVQVIPRANWGKLKLDDASDIGFLRADPGRCELLFEGDKECYRIPGAAITSCEIETFISGEGTHGATKLFRVVVQANHSSGFWEVPFAQRGNTGKFRTKKREKWARELQAQIRGLMPPAA